MKPLVIGVGNRWRGDDGIGPRVVEAIASMGRDDLDLLVLDGEAARLASAWRGRRRVVVVDAMRAGAVPGTIHRLVDLDRIPLAPGGTSTHGGGVAAAVSLAGALGVLPDHLAVIGIEPAVVEHRDQLSAAVDARLGDLVARTLEEVSGVCA